MVSPPSRRTRLESRELTHLSFSVVVVDKPAVKAKPPVKPKGRSMRDDDDDFAGSVASDADSASYPAPRPSLKS
jgi:hypothetical protein